MYDASSASSWILMSSACALLHTRTLATGIFYSPEGEASVFLK